MKESYKEIVTGSDFSGVGAFDFALERLGIKQNKKFACDWDKYARSTYILNHGEPENFPFDVYERKIPKTPLDVYVTTPPCQTFSLAGTRKGENDDRGVLFYNSHEFIQKNNPRFFILENVKGLLSDDKGRTFQTWVDMLGGKSVNGNPVIFPREDAAPYHIYHKVLNARKYGVPQNRERVFIVGIRDDVDNVFNWPKEIPLNKTIFDILEDNVKERYFLSEKMIKGFNKKKNFTGKFSPKNINDKHLSCITTRPGQGVTDNFVKVGYINQNTQASQVYSDEGILPNLCAGTHGCACGYVQVGAIRGRNPKNHKSRESGLHTEQVLEINKTGVLNTLTTVQKDNVLVINERIRRLTPRECFRGQDFPEYFKWNVSDTQAYKQAGNSIPIALLEGIISKLKL